MAKTKLRNVSRTLIVSAVCVLAVAFACILAGCGNASPTQTADEFMKALQANDSTSVDGIYDGNASLNDMVNLAEEDAENAEGDADATEADTSSATMDAMAEKLQGFEFKLGEEKIDGDTATVEVTITTYDMGKAFNNFFSNYLQQAIVLAFSGADEAQIEALADQILMNEIDSATMDYEKTVPLTMTKKNGKWVVDDLDGQQDFVNALTGGLLSAAESIENTLGSESGE